MAGALLLEAGGGTAAGPPVPWLVAAYPTPAGATDGELVGMLPGATDATYGELTAPFQADVLTGKRGCDT